MMLKSPHEYELEVNGKATDVVLAHFMKSELEAMDELQGGIHTTGVDVGDHEVQVRDYSKIGQMLLDQKFKAAMDGLKHDLLTNPESQDAAIKIDKKDDGEKFVDVESDFDPTTRLLAEMGEDGDNEIALIPTNLAEYFDELTAGPHINEHTGLRMYGWNKFRNKWLRPAVKIGATIVGTIFGGPAGGAAGRFVGGKLTGEDTRSALRNAAIAGATAWAVPHVGEYVSKTFPGFSSALASGSNAVIGQTATQNLGHFLTTPTGLFGAPASAGFFAAPGSMAGGFTGITGAPTAGGITGISALRDVPATAATGMASAAPATLTSTLKDLAIPALLGGAGLMYYKGHKEDKREHERKREHDAHAKEEYVEANRKAQDLGPLYMGSHGPDLSVYSQPRSVLRDYAKGGSVTPGEEEEAQGSYLGNTASALWNGAKAVGRGVGHVGSGVAAVGSGIGSVYRGAQNVGNGIAAVGAGVGSLYNGAQNVGAGIASVGRGVGYVGSGVGAGVGATYRGGKYLAGYKDGGPVKKSVKYVKFPKGSHFIDGPGKGQDDLIYGDVNDGDYIVDATSVAHLGDGSSKAAEKELDGFVKQVEKSPLYKKAKLTKVEKVPVALSDGEYKIERAIVDALGNGSNKAGADKLRSGIHALRHHKSQGGVANIPPKAKPLQEYLNGH